MVPRRSFGSYYCLAAFIVAFGPLMVILGFTTSTSPLGTVMLVLVGCFFAAIGCIMIAQERASVRAAYPGARLGLFSYEIFPEAIPQPDKQPSSGH